MRFVKSDSSGGAAAGWRAGARLLILLASASAVGFGQAAGAGQAVGEIRDPSSGVRWLLVHNAEHPGGPGRLVEVQAGESGRDAGKSMAAPVIRTGNRIRVEEHTAVLDAVLEGVALEGVAEGSTFRVKLSLGGRVVRAVALGPGQAVLAPEPGPTPGRWR